MLNVAVILAGGSGQRMGSQVPKQFLKVGDKTILEYTVEKFECHPQIDEIVVVVHRDYLDHTQKLIQKSDFQKVTHILTGGKERYNSTLAALKIYTNVQGNILVHDAVRPIVSERIISEVISGLSGYSAVNVAIPVTDTIIQVELTHMCITNMPDRKSLYKVQTPQGFHIQTLQQAYALAMADPKFTTTDDCGVVYKYLPEEKIKIVQGDPNNIKLTYASDIILLEHLLKNK